MNNKEEMKELLKEIIRESLTVEFDNKSDYDYDKLTVSILLDGEKIDSDYVNVTHDGLVKE